MVAPKSMTKEDFEEILKVNSKLLELQLQTNIQFEEILEYIETHSETQKELSNISKLYLEKVENLILRINEANASIVDLNKNTLRNDSDNKDIKRILIQHMDDESEEITNIKNINESVKTTGNETKISIAKLSEAIESIKQSNGKIEKYIGLITIGFSTGLISLIWKMIEVFVLKK